MTLKEYVGECSPGCVLRIGAKSGCGWFYSGLAGKIDWEKLNKVAYKANLHQSHRNTFKPVEGREVLCVDESLRDARVKCIVVPGNEVTKIDERKDGKGEQTDPMAMHMSGIEKLCFAIIDDVVAELRDAYMKVKKAQDAYMACLQNAGQLEDWITESTTTALISKEPEGIIREVREEVFGDDSGIRH